MLMQPVGSPDVWAFLAGLEQKASPMTCRDTILGSIPLPNAFIHPQSMPENTRSRQGAATRDYDVPDSFLQDWLDRVRITSRGIELLDFQCMAGFSISKPPARFQALKGSGALASIQSHEGTW